MWSRRSDNVIPQPPASPPFALDCNNFGGAFYRRKWKSSGSFLSWQSCTGCCLNNTHQLIHRWSHNSKERLGIQTYKEDENQQGHQGDDLTPVDIFEQFIFF